MTGSYRVIACGKCMTFYVVCLLCRSVCVFARCIRCYACIHSFTTPTLLGSRCLGWQCLQPIGNEHLRCYDHCCNVAARGQVKGRPPPSSFVSFSVGRNVVYWQYSVSPALCSTICRLSNLHSTKVSLHLNGCTTHVHCLNTAVTYLLNLTQ